MTPEQAVVWLLGLATAFLPGCGTTERDWKAAKNANTVSAYTAFLTEHPKGPRSDEAIAAIDDLEWNSAKSKNSTADYNNYIQKYPAGRNVAEAKAAIDALPVPYREAHEATAKGEHTDEFQAMGEIRTTDGCSVVDFKRSDGQPALLYLSAPIADPSGKMFDAAGVGTVPKSLEFPVKSVGILYVVGQVAKVNQADFVIRWKGCDDTSQQVLAHMSPTSRICQGNANLALDRLNPGDKITAELQTSGTPANSLVKAVVGGRTIRFVPFFQLHSVFLGQDFWSAEAHSCE